jgi:hypothetical protein
MSQSDLAEDRVPGVGSNSNGIAALPSNQSNQTYASANDIAQAILDTPLDGRFIDPDYVREVVRGQPPRFTAAYSAQRAQEVYSAPRARNVREALQSLQVALHIPADGMYGPRTEMALRGSPEINRPVRQWPTLAVEGGGTKSTLPSEAELTETEEKLSLEAGAKNSFRLVTAEGEEVGNVKKIVKHGFGNVKGTVVYHVEIELSHEDRKKVEDAGRPKEPPVQEHKSSLQRRELPQ